MLVRNTEPSPENYISCLAEEPTPKAGSDAKSFSLFLIARACKVALPYPGLFCELCILVMIWSTTFKIMLMQKPSFPGFRLRTGL